MSPDYTSFLYYCPSTDPNNYTLLGDESLFNIASCGTAIFTMNGRLVLFLNAPHIPSLRAPLYSTKRHRTQLGCAYYNEDNVGNLFLFSTMVIDVDSTTDKIFSFRPIGRTLRECKLDYAEPCLASVRLTKNPLCLESVDILIPTHPPT